MLRASMYSLLHPLHQCYILEERREILRKFVLHFLCNGDQGIKMVSNPYVFLNITPLYKVSFFVYQKHTLHFEFEG